MKLIYTTRDGRMTVEFEEDTQQDLWKELAKFQEVFEGALMCRTKDGKASSEVVRFQVRKDDDENEYFELICLDHSQPKLLWAKRAFGCHKKGGGLFPKNKTWVKWDNQKKEEVEI